MNRNKLITSLLATAFATAILGVSASAQAQDNTTPPPPSEPPPATHSSSNSISLAGGGGIGVGASFTLTGNGTGVPAGLFVYDVPLFHIEGLLGFFSQTVGPMNDRQTEWVFGVGGWYHLHRGSSSDFSLGAVIAIDTLSGAGASATVTSFEPGAQARAFLTPNLAVFGRVGFGLRFGDTGNGTQIGLGGQPVANFGFAYFFR